MMPTPSRRRLSLLVPLLLAALLIAALGPARARARSGYVRNVPNGNAMGCYGCHTDSRSRPFTAFGIDYSSSGGSWPRLYAMDSDGDGETNGQELGDPCGLWSRGATPARSTPLGNPGDPAVRSDAPPVDCSMPTTPDAGPPMMAEPDAGTLPGRTHVRSSCASAGPGLPARPTTAGLLLVATLALIRRRRRTR